MTFQLLSPAMIYSFALLVLLCFRTYVMQAKVWQKAMKIDDFSLSLFEMIKVLFLVPVHLVPLTHWPEIRKKVRYLNRWKTIQEEFRNVTGKKLVTDLRCISILAVIFAIVICVFFTSSNFLIKSYLSIWDLLSIMYCSMITTLLPITWSLSCRSFILAARLIEQEMSLHLSWFGPQRLRKIQQFKMLWFMLNKQARDLGESMGLTFGGLILVFFTLQVLCCYAFLFQLIIEIDDVHEILTVICSFVFGAIVYFQCTKSEEVSREIGMNFKRSIEMIKALSPPTNEDESIEIEGFLQMIGRHSSVINYCGFSDVNRRLYISLKMQTVPGKRKALTN
ncbi:gustatory and odorant receptor 24-like isoform X2 [Periplaneta americana]|uniref:gustatory and odorant receptor 24-like isoform X2 n=1 Tax=Periplaneta americana TaxID=6978 RepID=UPI0037E9B0C1